MYPELPPGMIVDPDFRMLRLMERGICSEPDCDEPIAGWCAVCDLWGPGYAPKLCGMHLVLHVARRTGHVAYVMYSDERQEQQAWGLLPLWLASQRQ